MQPNKEGEYQKKKLSVHPALPNIEPESCTQALALTLSMHALLARDELTSAKGN